MQAQGLPAQFARHQCHQAFLEQQLAEYPTEPSTTAAGETLPEAQPNGMIP